MIVPTQTIMSSSKKLVSKKQKRTEQTLESLFAQNGRWLSNSKLSGIRIEAYVAYFFEQKNIPIELDPALTPLERLVIGFAESFMSEVDRFAASKLRSSSRTKASRCAAERHAARVKQMVRTQFQLGKDFLKEQGLLDGVVAEEVVKSITQKNTHIDFPVPVQVVKKPREPNPLRPLEYAYKILQTSPIATGLAAAEALKIHLAELKKGQAQNPEAA